MNRMKKMNKKWAYGITISSLIVALICLLCISVLSGQDKEKISYDDYVLICTSANDSLNIGDYSKLRSQLGTDIVYIDKEVSFGRRSFLTIDDNASELVTQKRIEYLSEDRQYLVVIDFVYLNSTLDNDLIYWNNPVDVEANKFMRNNYGENIVVFHNILVKTMIFATSNSPVNDVMLTDITMNIVEFLKTLSLK